MNISLICACKNRYNALRVSLSSWLAFDQIKEIIIVDWSSDEPLSHLTKLDERIKVIRVNNQEYFNQPQPLNLAASLATGDYILKVDTDYIFNTYFSFIEQYKPDDASFTTGRHGYKNPEVYNETVGAYVADIENMTIEDLSVYFNSYSHFFKYLTGLLFITKENFNKIGGYNENLGKYYAFEDDEIFERLSLLGLKENRIKFDYHLIHLPHPDKKRTENFEGFSQEQEQAIKDNMSYQYDDEDVLKWEYEYALSQIHIKENRKLIGEIKDYYVKPKTLWNIKQMNDQHYIAEMKQNKLEDFPTTYYVSLKESKDRQIKLEQAFAEYNVFPKAILSKRFAECDDVITGKYVYQLNEGTKGCCVSHLKAIQNWYETTDEDYAFFCEDDLSLETIQYWDFTWKDFISQLPQDWECIQLLTIRDDVEDLNLRQRYWNDWGATAYILKRSYAKKLIDIYIPYTRNNTYHLEIPNQDIMPLIENILFTSLGQVYTAPLFVENIDFNSTFVGKDDDVNEGQKNNHIKAHQVVMNLWKGQLKTDINDYRDEKPLMKTELEELLTDYALDTENDIHNFNLGVWYETEGHTAPALSFYLRCAERTENKDLAYEALIRGSYCYDKQGTRDGSAKSMLQQALVLLPKRPEAYFLLSRFSEKREWWTDCYIYADQALNFCDFNQPKLLTNVEYPGKYGLLFEKSIAAWWWGKDHEARMLLQEIKNNYVVSKDYYDAIEKNLLQMATGPVPESEIKYSKERHEQLRFKFPGSELIEKNYSQAFQDMFILSLLQGKKNGLYLEIGAQQPFYQNNTALLETLYDWKGISIEIKPDLCKMFEEQRSNQIVCDDATKINYTHLLDEFNQGTNFDYLQLDCEPSKTTFEILLSIPFEKYKFAIITYEHDHYVDLTNSYRDKSRKYLELMGYKMIVSNVSPTEWSPFEDWWIHPDLVNEEMVELMKDAGDNITDVRKYFFK